MRGFYAVCAQTDEYSITWRWELYIILCRHVWMWI